MSSFSCFERKSWLNIPALNEPWWSPRTVVFPSRCGNVVQLLSSRSKKKKNRINCESLQYSLLVYWKVWWENVETMKCYMTIAVKEQTFAKNKHTSMLPRMEEIFAYFFNLSTFVFDEILVAFPKSGYISEAFFCSLCMQISSACNPIHSFHLFDV